jgi:hypothetical protein
LNCRYLPITAHRIKICKAQIDRLLLRKIPKWFVLPGNIVERSETVQFADARYAAPFFFGLCNEVSQKFIS